ncbi:MAG: hypothetical protein IPH88_03845 [Bacteroidales bacterium]|nr:hypothetical protein [Bacteroidales bacterium]
MKKILIKNRAIDEIIIGFLLVVTGLLLMYNSIYFIYAYNYSSILFLFMVPMTTLVSELIISLFLVYSGYHLITNNQEQTIFIKITSIIIMIYPVNRIFIDLLRHHKITDSLNIILVLPLGLLLYLYISQRKFVEKEGHSSLIKKDNLKVLIGFCLFITIDLLFYSWNYMTRII